MNKNHIALLSIVFLLVSRLSLAQEIRDIIPPVKVTEGKTDSVLISDLFYAADYPVRFIENKSLNVSYDSISRIIAVTPKQGFTGLTLLDFVLNNTTYSIPVMAKSEVLSQINQKFTYKPENKAEKVSLVGSFNNWNREANPLTWNGTAYETKLLLEPGTYVYKFIVDGKEVLDPVNPERTPTGFETYNSVIRITDPSPIKVFLHQYAYSASNDKVTFVFKLECNSKAAKIAKSSFLALLDNKQINSEYLAFKENTVSITLPLKEFNGNNQLRAAVVFKNKVSNLQTIYLSEGKPVNAAHKNKSWEDGIIYSMMIDRFNDGDKSNSIPVVHDSLFHQANYMGGDFQGIINKIDDGYFDSLGINILWISPVYDNPSTAYREFPAPHRWYSGYHGYWPVSATGVEEKFGNMDKLKELVAKAHKHNYKVLLDIVAHHVHIEHPFYKNHPEWFGKLELPDGRKNLRLWDEYRLTTWFEPYMPSFDYTASSEAIDTMASNCIWWLKETGADGFRHDAVKHVPNLFWRELTRKLKAEIEIPKKTKVYQIGETFGDNELIASYVNNGQLSAQFNFNQSYLSIPIFLEKDKSFETLDYHMSKTFSAFGVNHVMGNIMDSHDKVRFMAYADGKVKAQGVDTREMAWYNPPVVDHPESYDKAKLYYAFMFTVPGLPIIYYGSEFGMTGADDPDNRRMMRFGADLSENEKRMLNETKKIVSIRNSHSALRYGDYYTVLADQNIYSYLRTDFNERILVTLNKAENDKQVSLKLPIIINAKSVVDVITGEKFAVKNNTVSFSVERIGYRIFKVIN